MLYVVWNNTELKGPIYAPWHIPFCILLHTFKLYSVSCFMTYIWLLNCIIVFNLTNHYSQFYHLSNVFSATGFIIKAPILIMYSIFLSMHLESEMKLSIAGGDNPAFPVRKFLLSFHKTGSKLCVLVWYNLISTGHACRPLLRWRPKLWEKFTFKLE